MELIHTEQEVEEIEGVELVSSCCFEDVIEIGSTKICTQCEETCHLAYPPCPDGVCDGSGLVPALHWDQDMKMYFPDGDEQCIHLRF